MTKPASGTEVEGRNAAFLQRTHSCVPAKVTVLGTCTSLPAAWRPMLPARLVARGRGRNVKNLGSFVTKTHPGACEILTQETQNLACVWLRDRPSVISVSCPSAAAPRGLDMGLPSQAVETLGSSTGRGTHSWYRVLPHFSEIIGFPAREYLSGQDKYQDVSC